MASNQEAEWKDAPSRGRKVEWTKREAVEMAEKLLAEDETEAGDWVDTARTLLQVMSMMVAEDMDRKFARKPD